MAKRKYPTIPIDEALSSDVNDDIVAINRTAAVVKGGRRFSFSALSVVGNEDGLVGIGYGKGREVPNAVEKSVKDARKQVMRVVRQGRTIPHFTEGNYGATRVRLIPAAPGTGIIAGKAVRKVLEKAGIKDILTKNYGSTNAVNVVKATMAALSKLRSRETVAALRGVTLE
ncbi:MAG: 30S ribosomal protein S5 [Planctomycetota bacterium]|jgi:small subunit ribosomal protein S5|nr:30S ribosomal protein S5 [Planctomycetota bacterium]MSR39347.1 30S ribosomal protein S5 [Planctomycetota bacterium]